MLMDTKALALALAFFLAAVGLGFAAPAPPKKEVNQMLTLVNRDHPIGKEYVPETLVMPQVKPAPGKESNIQLRPEAAAALEKLFLGAQKDGITLYAVSGYRSFATQRLLFQNKAEQVGEKQAMRTVAPPGTSEHQLGLAMDVNGRTTLKLGLVQAFAESPEGMWVADHAHRYGFIIRYPKGKTDITGYSWEPWHLRYIGVEAALQVHSLDITLEEYHLILEMAGHT